MQFIENEICTLIQWEISVGYRFSSSRPTCRYGAHDRAAWAILRAPSQRSESRVPRNQHRCFASIPYNYKRPHQKAFSRTTTIQRCSTNLLWLLCKHWRGPHFSSTSLAFTDIDCCCTLCETFLERDWLLSVNGTGAVMLKTHQVT